MLTTIIKQLKPAFLMLFWMTIVTGMIYPLVMSSVGKVLFPIQTGGSLIEKDGEIVGSSLIGQPFSAARYFKGRPSATLPYEYNGESSMGSNAGPSNPMLGKAVAERSQQILGGSSGIVIPMDLLTTSASGLDPHISPEAAEFQIARVAKARGMSSEKVATIVEKNTLGRLWGFWGEPRVNVLELNLALDAVGKEK